MGFAHLVRDHVPGLYHFAVKKLSSEAVRSVRALPRLPAENRLIKENLPRFAVNIDSRMGLGASLSWSVGVLGYCEEQNLLPRLLFTNPLYATVPGEDWLERYFRRKEMLCELDPDLALPRQRYLSPNVNLMRRLRPTFGRLTLKKSRSLFLEALSFRDELTEEVDEFCRTTGVGPSTVAVHYRGTDKHFEATRPEWAEIARAVEKLLPAQKPQIFVATDEPDFLTFMKARFGAEAVIDLDCQEIFSGLPAHYSQGNPDIKAREALKTILILSRCGFLVRTRSHLSAWAKILRPELPTFVLGEMLAGDQFRFPEHLIGNDAQ